MEIGRTKFIKLYEKYEPLTQLLLDFKNRWPNSIYNISYEYFLDDDAEIVYYITFSDDVKDALYDAIILNKINEEIQTLDKDILKDLNFRIEDLYRTTHCSECGKKRKEHGKNIKES